MNYEIFEKIIYFFYTLEYSLWEKSKFRQMTKVIPCSVISFIFGTLFLLSPLTVQANSGDPNGIKNLAAPGWSLWQPKAEIDKADFDSGFSNTELGGYLDFQNFCTTHSGLPDEKIDYWFRLSNSVNRIGTGKVEFGCWVQGRFLSTFPNTAIKKSLSNVNCLRVFSANKKGLIIRSEPRNNSRQVGLVANRRTVKPDSFPAGIVEVDGENWVSITAPKKGWVSDGSFAGSGNLRLCTNSTKM